MTIKAVTLALAVGLAPLVAHSPLSAAPQVPSYIDRPADSAGVFAIWPGSGIPPGSEKWSWHEQSTQASSGNTSNRMVRNVAIPTVTVFKPASDANGTAVIIAPGGAYRFLMIDYEGIDMAHWLTQHGVTAFVLKYRVAHTPDNDADMPAFLQNFSKVLRPPAQDEAKPPALDQEGEAARLLADEDGRQAIRFVRQHAADWAIDPKRIGIAGFSAGGGVVMGTVMRHDAGSRPDFAAPIYPAYEISTPVPTDAPPLFIALADDDRLVAPISGARLYEAWHAAGKPAELHIFLNGEHGFGMKKQNLLADSWIDLFGHWLTKVTQQ